MKKSITIIVIILIAAWVVFAGARQIQSKKAALPKSIGELQLEKGIPVETAIVVKGLFTLSRSYLGTTEGALQGDAVASISERIVELPVKIGQRVKKGQVVCRMDTRSSMAQYNQLKLAYQDAVREAERMKNLYEAGAISQQALEKAELNRDITEQNLKSSSDVIAITAPISGVVTDFFFRVGETPESGKPVVRVADLGKIRVKFNANSDDRRMIDPESPVFIRINGDGQQEIAGRIADISLSADAQSRLFTVWVEATNSEIALKPGLLVDLRVVVVQKPDVIQVPRDALITRNEKPGIFVIGPDNKAVFSPIQKGEENATSIEILGGLQPGQKVVTFGQNNLSDGQLVNVVK
ncbi:MAG: efflux RND transporter periplasmic adaptor subunit [bacterium]|nr:efflux RND transporter periplasmic adaptor subunit [bacterium]